MPGYVAHNVGYSHPPADDAADVVAAAAAAAYRRTSGVSRTTWVRLSPEFFDWDSFFVDPRT